MKEVSPGVCTEKEMRKKRYSKNKDIAYQILECARNVRRKE